MGFSFRKIFPGDADDAERQRLNADSAAGFAGTGHGGNGSSGHPSIFSDPQPTDRGSFEELFAGSQPRGGIGMNGHAGFAAPAPFAAAGSVTLTVADVRHLIPPALASAEPIPPEQPLSIPLPAGGSRDSKLSTLYQVCPQLFAVEITPLNDSQLTLPEPPASAVAAAPAQAAPAPVAVPVAAMPASPFGAPAHAGAGPVAAPDASANPPASHPSPVATPPIGASPVSEHSSAFPGGPVPVPAPASAPPVSLPPAAAPQPGPSPSAVPAASESPAEPASTPPSGFTFGAAGGSPFTQAVEAVPAMPKAGGDSPFDIDNDNPFFLADEEDGEGDSVDGKAESEISQPASFLEAAEALAVTPPDATTTPVTPPSPFGPGVSSPAPVQPAAAEPASPQTIEPVMPAAVSPAPAPAPSGSETAKWPGGSANPASPFGIVSEPEPEAVAERAPQPVSVVGGQPAAGVQSPELPHDPFSRPAAPAATAVPIEVSAAAPTAPEVVSSPEIQPAQPAAHESFFRSDPPSPFGQVASDVQPAPASEVEVEPALAPAPAPVPAWSEAAPEAEPPAPAPVPVAPVDFTGLKEAMAQAPKAEPAFPRVAEAPSAELPEAEAEPSAEVATEVAEGEGSASSPRTLFPGVHLLTFPLRALLDDQEVEVLGFSPDVIPPDAMARLPQSRIESQLASGRVAVSIGELAVAADPPYGQILAGGNQSAEVELPQNAIFHQLGREVEAEVEELVDDSPVAEAEATTRPSEVAHAEAAQPEDGVAPEPEPVPVPAAFAGLPEIEEPIDNEPALPSSGSATGFATPFSRNAEEDAARGEGLEAPSVAPPRTFAPVPKPVAEETDEPTAKVWAPAFPGPLGGGFPEALVRPANPDEPVEDECRADDVAVDVGEGEAPDGSAAVAGESEPDLSEAAGEDFEPAAVEPGDESGIGEATPRAETDEEETDEDAEELTFYTPSQPETETDQDSKPDEEATLADSLDTLSPAGADLVEVPLGDSLGGGFFDELDMPPFSFEDRMDAAAPAAVGQEAPGYVTDGDSVAAEVAAEGEMDDAEDEDVETFAGDTDRRSDQAGDTIRDIELRAVFGTEEEFTLRRVAELTLDLCSSIDSCAVLTRSRAVETSRRAESDGRGESERRARQARAMHRNLRDLADNAGFSQAETLTLHTDGVAVSFFHRGEACLLVRHDRGGFPAGVREKLMLVARGVAQLEGRG